VKPGVLADDESPGYYGRKKTLVTDDAMRGASPTGCAESRMGKADEVGADPNLSLATSCQQCICCVCALAVLRGASRLRAQVRL
jgi:hypothetical protein